MKALNYKTILLCWLVIFSSTNNLFSEEGEIFSKTVKQEFLVNEQTLLDINNKFGKIDFIDWEKNSVNLEVLIIVKDLKKEKADAILNKISIKIEELESLIKIETIIEESRNKNKSGEQNFEINYTVSLPRYLKLKVQNKFGDIFINEHNGKSNFDVQFGDFRANKLMFDDSKPMSTISASYGNVSIGTCTWAKFLTSFGDLSIDECKAIISLSSYSDVKIKNVSSLICDSKFDSYKIGTVNNLVLNAGYVDIEVQKIINKLELDMEFGDFEVKEISPEFKEIKIINEYGTIDLELNENISYNLDATVEYCEIEFDGGNNLNIVKNGEGKKISGKFGPDINTTAKITIDSKFGEIELN